MEEGLSASSPVFTCQLLPGDRHPMKCWRIRYICLESRNFGGAQLELGIRWRKAVSTPPTLGPLAPAAFLTAWLERGTHVPSQAPRHAEGFLGKGWGL